MNYVFDKYMPHVECPRSSQGSISIQFINTPDRKQEWSESRPGLWSNSGDSQIGRGDFRVCDTSSSKKGKQPDLHQLKQSRPWHRCEPDSLRHIDLPMYDACIVDLFHKTSSLSTYADPTFLHWISIRSNRQDIQEMLVAMGFERNYVQRAFKVYEVMQ